jgi:hypothetical protein
MVARTGHEKDPRQGRGPETSRSGLSCHFSFPPNGHCRPRTGRDRSPDINLRAFFPFSALRAGIKMVWRRRSPNVAVPLRLQGFALPVSSPVRTPSLRSVICAAACGTAPAFSALRTSVFWLRRKPISDNLTGEE